MIHSEFAPAKINLFLDVLCKRPDGYHDIGTLFQTIDAGDSLRAESDRSGAIRLTYDAPQEYPVLSDLVYKAAVLLQKEYKVSAGVRLHLEKRMPLGAGLGGGSADAAAALRLLNRIWGVDAALPDLAALGARLGADVPFLVEGGSALATGIGDVLQPLPAVQLPRGMVLLVATPHCAVPTAAAYGGISPSGEARWDAFRSGVLAAGGALNPLDPGFGLFNKFEESVFPKYPAIVELGQKMRACGAVRTLMSGSGASVFAFFENRAGAEHALESLRYLVRWACVTQFFFPNLSNNGATAL